MAGSDPSRSAPLIPRLPPHVRGRTSLQIFLGSLHAFLLREMKNQFGRFRLGYFWAVAEPAAVVAILTFLHAFIRGSNARIYADSPVVFFVFGAVPYFLFMNCFTSAQGVCTSHKGLFNYRQVKPVDAILARCLIDAQMMIAVLALFLAGWWWLGHEIRIDDPLMLIVALASLLALGLALGLLFEVYGTIFMDVRKVSQVMTRPLLFVSGVFFTIEMVPQSHRHYLTWNPVLHGVDLTRDAVLVGYTSPASFAYLWICTLVLLFVGLAGYRRYLHQLI